MNFEGNVAVARQTSAGPGVLEQNISFAAAHVQGINPSVRLVMDGLDITRLQLRPREGFLQLTLMHASGGTRAMQHQSSASRLALVPPNPLDRPLGLPSADSQALLTPLPPDATLSDMPSDDSHSGGPFQSPLRTPVVVMPSMATPPQAAAISSNVSPPLCMGSRVPLFRRRSLELRGPARLRSQRNLSDAFAFVSGDSEVENSRHHLPRTPTLRCLRKMPALRSGAHVNPVASRKTLLRPAHESPKNALLHVHHNSPVDQPMQFEVPMVTSEEQSGLVALNVTGTGALESNSAVGTNPSLMGWAGPDHLGAEGDVLPFMGSETVCATLGFEGEMHRRRSHHKFMFSMKEKLDALERLMSGHDRAVCSTLFSYSDEMAHHMRSLGRMAQAYQRYYGDLRVQVQARETEETMLALQTKEQLSGLLAKLDADSKSYNKRSNPAHKLKVMLQLLESGYSWASERGFDDLPLP